MTGDDRCGFDGRGIADTGVDEVWGIVDDDDVEEDPGSEEAGSVDDECSAALDEAEASGNEDAIGIEDDKDS